MARLRPDQQKESDDCHYVVTLSTQIFLDGTFAETASRGTSFVGMAREIYPKGIVRLKRSPWGARVVV
jgi:hypothetical protein